MSIKTQQFLDHANDAFHRYSGSPVPDWMDILPERSAKFMCLDCRRKQVQPPVKYCPNCIRIRRLGSNRKA